MRTPLTAVLSCCASMLATCAAVILLWTVANLLYVANTLPLGTALPAAALIGFAACAGIESGTLLAHRRQTATGALGGTLLTVAALLIIYVLLGVAFGVSLSIRAQPPVSVGLLVAAMTCVSFLSGLTVTLRPRPFVSSSIAIVANCMLGGVALGLGFGLQFAASYRPCPMHSYCLDPRPWYGLQGGLPAGAVFGVVLGLFVWLAFSLDLAISSLLNRPPATESA